MDRENGEIERERNNVLICFNSYSCDILFGISYFILINKSFGNVKNTHTVQQHILRLFCNFIPLYVDDSF